MLGLYYLDLLTGLLKRLSVLSYLVDRYESPSQHGQCIEVPALALVKPFAGQQVAQCFESFWSYVAQKLDVSGGGLDHVGDQSTNDAVGEELKSAGLDAHFESKTHHHVRHTAIESQIGSGSSKLFENVPPGSRVVFQFLS